jgi:hypothetical protein
MVHRTDIAGGIMGHANPSNDRMCQRALNGAVPERNPSPELVLLLAQAASSAAVSSRRQSRRFLTSISNSWPYEELTPEYPPRGAAKIRPNRQTTKGGYG